MDLSSVIVVSFVISIMQPITFGVGVGFAFLVILLFCSALISGSEMAYFSIDAKHIETIKANKKYHRDAILALLSQPQKLLATILI